MKKINDWVPLSRNLRKLLLTMKLCLLFLLVSTATLLGNNGYSQNTGLSIHLKDATLKELIEAIESQSEFIFVYYDGIIDLNKRISIDVTNKKVDQILEKVFESTDKTYRINDRQITIGRKDPVTKEFIPDRPKPLWGEQNKKITGSVTDEKGEALPGVSIVIKGILQGTITDSDGSFTLTNVPDHAVLVFSFVGMKTQELEVGNKTVFDVVMEEQTTGLDEVVVVAYGTQKKETLTGSIASIQTDEIKQSPSANLSVALAGRLPGLTTIQSNGQPGQDNTTLYLRGRSTTNGQDPLILVDGVPRDMTYIDPNEVENVTILKDASSTALFGVRGANGVILITTRRGKNAKPEISFSSEVGLQSFTRFPDSLHSWEHAELRNQASENDGLEHPFSEEDINHYRNQDNPLLYPDNNWRNIMADDYSVQQRYNLSMSGSIGERANYFVNVGYLNQDGLWKVDQPDYDPSTWLKRYNFRSNIDIKLNETLSCFINAAGYLETANQAYYSTGEIMNYTMLAPPTQAGPVTPDGEVLTTVN